MSTRLGVALLLVAKAAMSDRQSRFQKDLSAVVTLCSASDFIEGETVATKTHCIHIATNGEILHKVSSG